ncbi:MAG: hypothetical protein ACI9XR_002728 [Flavobacterium sp.]|jgi:hypothetical protein
MFENRSLFIATKHQKEKVIAPILNKELQVNCFSSDSFDTDSFGTFSGEIERKSDALSTVRLKCIEANKFTKCDLILASEGSFGVHPSLFFAQADEEIIMLKDFKNDLEIVVREISLDTNFGGALLLNEKELIKFLENSKFPSHGIILKSSEKNFQKVYKGIIDEKKLLLKFNSLIKEFGVVYAETDMRAMFNPTRMKVIALATKKLIDKIKSKCPECSTPGFDILKANPGLVCANCNSPTRSILSLTYQCQKCFYQTNILYPKGKTKEDPTFCDNCNP